jgi:MFS family permease
MIIETPEIVREGKRIPFKTWYFLIIGYFYFGQGYALASLALFLPLYIKDELGVGNYTNSVIISSIIISPWYVKILFGILSDNFPIGQFGRRKPYFVIATFFSILGWLTLGLHSSASYLFVLSGLSLAIGSSISDSVIDALSVEITPQEYIARLQGVAWGSRGLGIGITGVGSALIVDNYSWQTMFYVSSIFGISISIIVLILPQRVAYQQAISKSNQVTKSIRKLLGNKYSKKHLQFIFMTGIALSIIPLLPILLEREFSYSVEKIGYAALTFAIGSFVGAIVNGMMFDRHETFNRVRLLSQMYVISICLGLAFLYSFGTVVEFTYFFILGSTAGAYEGYQLKIIQELSPEHIEGTAFSLFTGVSNIGQFALGSVLIIFIAEIFDISMFLPLQVTILIVWGALIPLRSFQFDN